MGIRCALSYHVWSLFCPFFHTYCTFLLLLLFQNADQVILEFSKKCTELDTSMTVFHNELSLLPEVIKNIETAKADIG